MSFKSDLDIITIRLQESMKQSGLSYGEISSITNIPKSAVHRYISGDTPKIPLDRLEKISNAMGVSAAWVMGWEEENKNIPAPGVTEDYTTFPVIGEVAAGYDSIALEDWEGDTVDIPNSYLRGRATNEFFVLRVKGDSMYPTYQEGDKVLVLKQSTLNYSGQVGVILYDDDYASLKKVEYRMGENWLRMVPINPTHPTKKVKGEDLEHCHILGIPRLLIREIDD